MPAFFGSIYTTDQYKTLYSILNAFVIACAGFISSFCGALASDYFEKKNYMSKSYICILGSLLGCPTIAMCCLTTNSFYLSIAGLFLEYLFAECWSAPAIGMI
jgi:hypothetical protein